MVEGAVGVVGKLELLLLLFVASAVLLIWLNRLAAAVTAAAALAVATLDEFVVIVKFLTKLFIVGLFVGVVGVAGID